MEEDSSGGRLLQKTGHNDREEEMKKRRIGDIVRIGILIVAFSVLLYPTVSNYLYAKNSSGIAKEYDQRALSLPSEEKLAMLQAAREYNQSLTSLSGFTDPFSAEGEKGGDQQYEALLDVDGRGMMGYITIPKINVKLPIYHGVTEDVLQAGVGHLTQSSLPVGGEGTHAVLTGHRGLPSARLFTDLDQVAEGDIFYLYILDEILAYQVDQILTVKPEDTQALEIESGQDYVTLITCTPYGVNTHRLLIRGTRIPYEEAVEQTPDETDGIYVPFEIKILGIGLAVLAAVWIVWMVGKRLRRRRKRDEKQ